MAVEEGSTTAKRPDPDEWTKQQWKEAERAHDRQDKGAEVHSKQVEAFAIQGIRTLGLVAAGGIAATLGFYSANFDRLSASPANLARFNGILACLFVSLLFTLLCVLFAYFSQIYYGSVIQKRERPYAFPYVVETAASESAMRYGNIFRFGSVIAAALATLCLVAAGLTFLDIVR